MKNMLRSTDGKNSVQELYKGCMKLLNVSVLLLFLLNFAALTSPNGGIWRLRCNDFTYFMIFCLHF